MESRPFRDSRPFRAPDYQPPLANELFASRDIFGQIVARLPYLAGIIPDLRRYAVEELGTIEERLTEMETDGQYSALRRRQLSAVRFYLRDAIGLCSDTWGRNAFGISNYARLLDRLLRWQESSGVPIVFVTFNYDTLLEQALKGFGLKIASLDHYIERDSLRLVKAHGSIDWCHPVEASYLDHTTDKVHGMIEDYDQITVSPEFLFEPKREQLSWQENYLYPALAIPVKKDKRFECPDHHVDVLRTAAAHAKRLLVIGWAGADPHFLNLLRDQHCSPDRTLVVCGSDAGSAATNEQLALAGIKRNCEPVPTGFSDLFRAEPDPLAWLLG